MPLIWLAACTGTTESEQEAETTPNTPSVVVLVVAEGLSDETARPLRKTLEGGLARLSRLALAARVYHGHQTLTACPGHATLSTGASPSTHGIPADRWWLEDQPVDCWAKDTLLADTLADQVRVGGGQVAVLTHDVAAGTLYSGDSTGASAWLVDGAWASGWQGVPAWVGEAPPTDVEGLGQAAAAAAETLSLGADASGDLLVLTTAVTLEDPVQGLARLDAALAPLATQLDAVAGERGWTLVLTGSHGLGAPLEAVDATPLHEAVQAAIQQVYSEGEAPFVPPDLYLPSSVRRESTIKSAVQLEVRTRLAQSHPEWQVVAWTDLSGLDPEDPRTPQIERGTYGLRSGDLLVFPAPGTRFAEADARAPEALVPLWAAGPGVVPMGLTDSVDSRDLAPTIAAWLGVEAPDNAEGTAVLQ